MRVTILGCGGSAGVPHIGGKDGNGDWGACDPTEPRNRRSRSSVLLQWDNFNLLVDTSPDLRTQLLGCQIARVDAVLFTHTHADHVAGVDEVRILNRIIQKPLPAYITATSLTYMHQRYEYVLRPHPGGFFYRPVLDPIVIAPGDTVKIGGRKFQIFEQDHEVTKSIGFRVGNFAYSTDVIRVADSVFDLLAGIDTWVLAAFQRKPHFTHLNVDQALEWSKRVGSRRTVLTHMGNDLDWAWLQKRLPAGAEAGYDGMAIEVAE